MGNIQTKQKRKEKQLMHEHETVYSAIELYKTVQMNDKSKLLVYSYRRDHLNNK